MVHVGNVLVVGFVAVLGVSLLAGDDTLATMLIVNAVGQLVLFALVACRPFLRTGRMSYVDIAWPFGVALIGVVAILLGDGAVLRRVVTGAVYLMIGLRMGIGALTLGRSTGMIFQREFPRYEYRRMVLEDAGVAHPQRHMLAEIMAQGLANTSVLALPGFMLAVNASRTISEAEVIGLILWAVAYAFESTADLQKMRFIAREQGDICNVGLWRYSRHPNYFGQWLVWTGLVIAATPSWWSLRDGMSWAVWVVLGFGAVGASGMLYITLNYLTGAVPAEYYSRRKRPGYAAYQATTNRFFPWFPRPYSQ